MLSLLSSSSFFFLLLWKLCANKNIKLNKDIYTEIYLIYLSQAKMWGLYLLEIFWISVINSHPSTTLPSHPSRSWRGWWSRGSHSPPGRWRYHLGDQGVYIYRISWMIWTNLGFWTSLKPWLWAEIFLKQQKNANFLEIPLLFWLIQTTLLLRIPKCRISN